MLDPQNQASAEPSGHASYNGITFLEHRLRVQAMTQSLVIKNVSHDSAKNAKMILAGAIAEQQLTLTMFVLLFMYTGSS